MMMLMDFLKVPFQMKEFNQVNPNLVRHENQKKQVTKMNQVKL